MVAGFTQSAAELAVCENDGPRNPEFIADFAEMRERNGWDSPALDGACDQSNGPMTVSSSGSQQDEVDFGAREYLGDFRCVVADQLGGIGDATAEARVLGGGCTDLV